MCLTTLPPNILKSCHAQGTATAVAGSTLSSYQFYSDFTSPLSPAYRTIKVTQRSDIERLYPLLLSYITEPNKANSLREVIVDTHAWPNFYSCFYEANEADDPPPRQDSGEGLNKKRPNRQINQDAHSALERHVTSLGLGDQLTEKIVGALTWKKKHWSGEVPDNARDFDDNERTFATTALIILFSLCEQITILRIAEFPTLLREYLLKNNYGQLNRFALQQLQTVEFVKEYPLDNRVYETVEFLEYIRHFGKLPAMESLTMEGVMETEVNDLVSPGTSNIKNIHLTHCEISGSTLSKMIRSSKALKELRVSLGGLWHMDMGAWNIRPQTVGKSLLQHQNSLKMLDLDILDFDFTEIESWENSRFEDIAQNGDEYFELDKKSSTLPFWQEDIPDDRPYSLTIGSLHDFNAMTHLGIGLNALFGPSYGRKEPPFRLIDGLPPNLEYLCLYGYVKGECEEIDSHVNELMQHKAKYLPRLANIQGVDETVLGVSDLYADDNSQMEDNLWQWPEMKLEWVEAEA
ncbi:f-box domain containing protein [Fusarium sporotrichioides]|uniref:F-box domain containing protein n=1 Tax=Fusarium sporotrichioides TaxID=5514 RepID=A0A395RMY7_FUSSP|nr:f-box domain containing protein [Fusarium sporotrichioides]